ncbi:DUF4362 domain-containing protein [Cohnella zeiphila]|uniref:DUF4362 domain-containing protein n=1 Tax=Cohnella zeiphila TaxID=2761120 RepID=A0A7X0SRW3_9BACL|nr:DUF4362 domain-containing protein [Cohnella zeiphila]MBB6733979.1 DUF4362 domain-containing protein [Cohnella zeiphila]
MRGRLFLILSFAVLLLVSCTDKGGRTAAGLPAISKPYGSDRAIENGDIVNAHGKLYNGEKWNTFMSSLENHAPSAVRITQYTTEGDPIFYELAYDGSSIRYTYDNSMDKFGADTGRPSTSCQNVELQKKAQDRQGYALTGCDNTETGDTFWFSLP